MRLGQIFEIICDRGDAALERWSVGSGYLVRNNVVLTAAHVVDGAVSLTVRLKGVTEYPASVLLFTGPDVDLALLNVPGRPAQQPVAYATVSRAMPGRISGCCAVGFPRFKEVRRDGRRVRDSVQVDGYLPTAEGLVSGYLTLHADSSPRELAGGSESAWAGMSGAGVFAGDALVGVVSEHHLAEGEGSLTVVPLDRIERCEPEIRHRFWQTLHIADPTVLPRLQPERAPEGVSVQVGTLLALPEPLSDFTGRQAEVQQLAELLSGRLGGRAAVIWGPPGVGKSQLAVHVAYELVSLHPDGACLIDLQGYSANRLTPELAAARLLDTLAPGHEVPAEPAARFAACRAMLRGGDYVVVLDNANAAAQVRDLIPGAGETAVLITSRAPLSTLDARLVELDLLETASGIQLIRTIVERDGPRQLDQAQLEELVGLCGNLPLALRVAGALLRARPNWTVQRLLDRLRDESRRLDLLERDDLAVRPVFESAFAVLDVPARRLFGLLGSVGALRIAPWMAAGLLDADPDTAEEVLERLVDAQLLRPAGPDLAGTFRYRFHDLVRLYAREKLAALPREEVRAGERRMLSGYLALALEYTRRHPIAVNFEFARTVELPWSPPDQPVPPDPMEWLLEERGDLVAEIEHAYAAGQWPYVWGLADILNPVFILSSHGTESREVKDLALAAARAAADADAELQVRFSLLDVLHNEQRFEEVFAELDYLRAERLRRGERRQAAHMAVILGVVQRTVCRLKVSEESLRLSLAELTELLQPGDPVVTAMIASAQHNLAIACRELGLLGEADALLDRALPAFEALDDAIAYGRSTQTRGILHCYLGQYDEAAKAYSKAHDLSRGVGDRRWTAIAVLSLARLAQRRGEFAEAAGLLNEADELFAAISDAAGRAQVLRSRAILLRGTGQYVDAERVFDAAHDALQAVPDRRSVGRLEYSRALMELARGRTAVALDRLDLADAQFTDEDDPVWRCRVRITRFRARPGIEDPDALAAELDRFAALAGEGFLPRWISEARRRVDA